MPPGTWRCPLLVSADSRGAWQPLGTGLGGSRAGTAPGGENRLGVSSGHLHIVLVGLPVWFISPRLWLSLVTRHPGAVSMRVSRGGEVPKVEERRFLRQDLSSC